MCRGGEVIRSHVQEGRAFGVELAKGLELVAAQLDDEGGADPAACAASIMGVPRLPQAAAGIPNPQQMAARSVVCSSRCAVTARTCRRPAGREAGGGPVPPHR